MRGGSLIAPRLTGRLPAGHTIAGTVALMALATVVLAAAATPLMLVVGGTIFTVALPIYRVTQVSYRLTLAPDELQGRVNSVYRLLAFATRPLGAAAGGVLLGLAGPRMELWLIAAGLGLGALCANLNAGV